ncbi:hypothetical protein ZWY2020_044080 [Hordeum vulgare]|nr:hypothetical protein ZWY2020_013966 [Hordeum vulgare]KAI5019192.1 hypothetical protein ZWY2020_044080 [Hordeum vulgare]
MEAKKSPPTPASTGSAAAGNGYFSSVFSASPAANPRDARQMDLYTMLNKQNPKGQSGGGTADGKSQGSPAKALHTSRPMNHREIIRRITRMAPWLPEVIGGKVHCTTKYFAVDSPIVNKE